MDLFYQREGMTMKKLFMILLLCNSILMFADSDEEIFLRGNQLYNQEKYADAFATYQRIGKKNNAVWYNMGNCFYLLQNYQNAYAFWRKAAKSCSTNQYDMAMANIRTAEQRLGKKRTFVEKIWFTIDGWQPLIMQLTFLFFWCILFWRAPVWYQKRKKILLSMLVLCLSVAGVALGLKYYQMQRTLGIIIHDQVSVFIGPNNEYQVIDRLTSGTEVAIVEQRERWIKIKNKQTKGWIARENILEL